MSEEKVTVAISASALDAMKCWKFYDYAKIQRVSGLSRPKYIDQGLFLHKVLEFYYKNKILGLPFDQNILDCLKRGRAYAIKGGVDIEVSEEVLKVFREYCSHYRHETLVPLKVEEPFSFVFHEDDKLKILGEGKLDLLARQEPEGVIRVVDHKKVSSNREATTLDNGVYMYLLATGADYYIKNDVGFQSTKDLSKKFVRQMLPVDKDVLEEWRLEIVDRVKEALARIEINKFPKNLYACTGKFGLCQYADLCSSKPANRDHLIKTMYTIGDKYDIFGDDEE